MVRNNGPLRTNTAGYGTRKVEVGMGRYTPATSASFTTLSTLPTTTSRLSTTGFKSSLPSTASSQRKVRAVTPGSASIGSPPKTATTTERSESAPTRESHKIVFLDIDGVICCNRFCRLEENKLYQLQRVCQSTGAKVCLSSDWRRTAEGRARVRETLKLKGIDLVGFTPQMPNDAVRPVEIVRWMNNNNKMAREGKNGRKHVSNYVAIDDRPLYWEKWGEKLSGRFVRTTFKRGLTKELADECIRILGEIDRPAIVWP